MMTDHELYRKMGHNDAALRVLNVVYTGVAITAGIALVGFVLSFWWLELGRLVMYNMVVSLWPWIPVSYILTRPIDIPKEPE
jgi:hypothetical protein